MVPASVADVVRALTESTERARWLRDADAGLGRALAAAFTAPKPRQVKARDAMNARLRYPWDGATVEIRITGKPAGGASVVADNMNLRDAADVESRRALWKTALDGLRRHLSR